MFASQDQVIEIFTTEQLEGALRGVVAKLTVEQVMQDRQELSDEIAEGISGDLLAQGLVLDRRIAQERADGEAYALRAQAEARQASAAAPAEAVRLQAGADAEAIRLAGEARASSIAAEAEALQKNQSAVLAREVVGQLPRLMAEFAKGYANVGSITLVGGDTAATHLAREQAESFTATFESVRAATGLDLTGVLQGHAIGRGIADGAAPSSTNGSAPSSTNLSTPNP